MRPAHYLICAKAVAVGPENSDQVFFGQADFENDCRISLPPVSSHWATVLARLLGQWINTFSWCPVLIPVGETKVNPSWLCGPARGGWRGARPHNHAKISGTTGYENHPTYFYLTRTRAQKLVLQYQ